MGTLSFTATLEPRGPAAAVVLDDEQVAVIGEGAKRFPVTVTATATPGAAVSPGWAGRACSG